jgi:hypothetical protein
VVRPMHPNAEVLIELGGARGEITRRAAQAF